MNEPESERGKGARQPKNQQFVALNRFRREHLRVDVYLVSGIRLTGRIKSFDQYTMLLETADGDAVVYHHAVSSIGRSMPRPKRAPRDNDSRYPPRPRPPAAPNAPPDVVVIKRRSRLAPGS
jgi:host factor-I protein